MKYYNRDFICHHGILGQRWGVRRYQNSDGSLTSAGRRRYGLSRFDTRKYDINELEDKRLNDIKSKKEYKKERQEMTRIKKEAHDRRVSKKIKMTLLLAGGIGIGAWIVHKHNKNIGALTSKLANQSMDDVSKSIIDQGKKYFDTSIKKNIDDAAKVISDTKISELLSSKGAGIIDSSSKNSVIKKEAIGALSALAPTITKSANDTATKALNNTGYGLVTTGVKNVGSGLKEGMMEGLKEGPKKAVKTVLSGGSQVIAKKILDEYVGKEESARIYQAADNKKISKFWKVSDENSNVDDDDED